MCASQWVCLCDNPPVLPPMLPLCGPCVAPVLPLCCHCAGPFPPPRTHRGVALLIAGDTCKAPVRPLQGPGKAPVLPL